MKNLLVIGLSHRTAPLEVRERIAVSPERLPAALARLTREAAIQEGLLLSTCNRTEVWAQAETADAGERALMQYLTGLARTEFRELERYLYVRRGPEALSHLFAVTAALDSMMVGEAQILGQVKSAYRQALEAGLLGARLLPTVAAAFQAARRVRRETAIARGAVSLSHAAVELARKIFDRLEARAFLLVGGGKMAHSALRKLRTEGVGTLYLTNRTFARAQTLADQVGGTPFPLEALPQFLPSADILLSAVETPEPLITRAMVEAAGRERGGEPLFLIDIAVPRSIAPAVNDLANVYLYNLDDLKVVVEANLRQRQREVDQARRIVEEEAATYRRRRELAEVDPLIRQLRHQIATVVSGELARGRKKLGPLTPEQEAALERICQGITQKLVHHPAQALKGARQDGDLLEVTAAIRTAFGLTPEEETTGEEAAGDPPPAPRKDAAG